jgi:hypothetical protein
VDATRATLDSPALDFLRSFRKTAELDLDGTPL